MRKKVKNGMVKLEHRWWFVEMETRSLHGYLVESQEQMLTAASGGGGKVVVETTESLEEYNKKLYESKVRDWKDKPLHSVCLGYRRNYY